MANITEEKFQIEGMSCASCVARIEKLTQKLEGVESAAVNLVTESAIIRFDQRLIDANAIAAAISKAGYETKVRSPEPGDAKIDDKILDKEKLRIVLSVLLTLPLLVPMLIGSMVNPYLQLALAAPVQFLIGSHFYVSAWKALRSGSGNMDLLVALGTSSAFALSLYNLSNGNHDLYFESSAVIITLVLLGKFLEARAKMQTGAAIRALQKLRPHTARIKTKDGLKEIPLSSVKLLDQLLIRPGESVPVDGEVLEGESSIDESMLTGESMPVQKKRGSTVTAGSINSDGVLLVETKAIGDDTALARIIRLVEDVGAKKPNIQKLVDKVSAVFVPAIILIALLTLAAWGFSSGDWQAALIHAVSVLVIACPCALGLATPTALLVGTGNAARKGILIRDADVLELLPKIQVVAFDKTGTITEGKPRVVRVDNEEVILPLAVALQQGSEHPLSLATIAFAKDKNLTIPQANQIKRITNGGIEGIIEGKAYKLIPAQNEYQEWQNDGLTVSLLVRERDVLGAFAFQDTVREESRIAIKKIKDLGLKTMLISGDNEATTQSIAESLGIDEHYARQSPESKASLIEAKKSESKVIAMVGDGINDAPALIAASISFAMGQGTDIAMQSSSVTLLGNHPGLVLDTILLAEKTLSKIKQNLFWAFIYNLIGIPLAAMGKLSPMVAGTAMALSSVCVVVNSLLLKNWKKT